MTESKVDLKKEVFSKSQYIKTIDTKFNELGINTLTEDLQSQVTVTEFFELYNSLFYDIPAESNINSHRYLVEQSGGYINFEEVNEEILALRQEIAQLRQELLQNQIQNATGGIPEENSVEFQNLNSELANIKDQINNLPTE